MIPLEFKLIAIAVALAGALVWAKVAVSQHDAKVTAVCQAGYAVQAAKAAASATAETQRREAQQGENNDEAYILANKARDAAVRSAAASTRLRVAAHVAVSSGRAVDSAASGSSPADRLADLLGECSERYSAVAAAADRAIVAGQLCTADYGALTP